MVSMRASWNAPWRAIRIALTVLTSFSVGALGIDDRAARAQAAAAESTGETWVQNYRVTELWSGPGDGAVAFGYLRQFSYLRVLGSAAVGRLYVFNPRSGNVAYVDQAAIGPSGPPPAGYLQPLRTVRDLDIPVRIVGSPSLYSEPVVDDATWLRNERHNAPYVAVSEVEFEGSRWLKLDSGEFVAPHDVRLPGPPAGKHAGKWIDADLSLPTLVTAYEGDRAVASALAIQGVPRWPTPVGTFTIFRRVANETMSSEGLGIPRSAPDGYFVENVLFTQYFTGDGASLHYNYWNANFGAGGSHGCLGLNYDDALWFWNWVEPGTPIVVHY